MMQLELDQAVAHATGESPATIECLGFSLLTDAPLDDDADDVLCLECPGCGTEVTLSTVGLIGLPTWAECPICDAAYPYQHAELYDLPLVDSLPVAGPLAACA